MTAPSRGFPRAEFAARTRAAQGRMADAGLAGLLLTQEADLRYFTGFLTRFWESPTRPWFLVIPASGDPIAVIPSIGAALMAQTWVADIRTWPAPAPGDDGVGLLTETLSALDGPIGIPSALESHMRMPRASYERLRAVLPVTDDHGIVAALRAVKSEAEIAKLNQACAIAGRAFDRVPEIAAIGTPLSEVFRRFQMLCLEEGADWVPYLAGGAGAGGYGDVISPATDVPLQRGDVLMLDTGLVWDGYFSDFDRNFSLGRPDPDTADAHARLIAATEAGRHAARPGARACDVYAAMRDMLGVETDAGRLGHGLGMQLTEGLSLIAADETVLVPGTVLTLEPGLPTRAGRIMVHEEVVVIREDGCEPLSPFAAAEIQVID